MSVDPFNLFGVPAKRNKPVDPPPFEVKPTTVTVKPVEVPLPVIARVMRAEEIKTDDELTKFIESNQPFSRKSLIQWPFLRTLWADVMRVEAAGWNWNKLIYQGWYEICDSEGEVIRKVKGGDIIGCILEAYGFFSPVCESEHYANIHSTAAGFYTGCTADFMVGLENGYMNDPRYKEYPGYFEGYSIANWQRENEKR